MKKKICILGSTGSIGLTTLKIVKENKDLLDVKLLSTNKNTKKLLKQIKEFNVKDVIISNEKAYTNFKRKYFKLNVFKNIEEFKKKIRMLSLITQCPLFRV